MPSHSKKNFAHSRKLVFFLILLVAWTILHELVHGIAILLNGHNVTFGYHLFFASVRCIDCAGISGALYAMFAVAPYIVDIAVIAGYLFYRKKALFWLSFVAFVDVILNYFAMVVWLFDKNAAIDFIIIGLAGYVWLPVVIAIAAFVIWAYSNQEIVLKLYKKFRK